MRRAAFIVVMTHPTTAGVLASFASLADVTVSEPGALLSFTGPRVVQQTVREKLPEDFGLAESNVRFGHLDTILPRDQIRPFLGRLLALFSNGRLGGGLRGSSSCGFARGSRSWVNFLSCAAQVSRGSSTS